MTAPSNTTTTTTLHHMRATGATLRSIALATNLPYERVKHLLRSNPPNRPPRPTITSPLGLVAGSNPQTCLNDHTKAHPGHQHTDG